MAIHRKFTEWGRRIDIGIGEVYCPECQGKGTKFKSNSNGNWTIKTPCGFCKGYGKTDWIQIATNEPRDSPPVGEYINYLKNNLAEFGAQCIAKEIDKEILKSLSTYGQAKTHVHYEMMKQFAKTAKVTVVTARQAQRTVLLDAAAIVTAGGLMTGLIGSSKDRSIKISLTS